MIQHTFKAMHKVNHLIPAIEHPPHMMVEGLIHLTNPHEQCHQIWM